jgi:aryl-alcohol dehydrogenase-like predicted oxidoreductase
MEYRLLGTTGVHVSALCLGAMMLGRAFGTDDDDGVRIVHRALDAGITMIDTADVYSAGHSEEIVGRALRGRRDDVVLATKFGARFGGDVMRSGGSHRRIVRSVEASLRRLGTDRIDVYQIHRPDPAADVDETLAALSDLVHAGKVLVAGGSNFTAEGIVEARWTAERRGRVPFRSEQTAYSILARAVEHDVLPTCQRHGLGVMVWSPLNGGWLTGRYRRSTIGDLELTARGLGAPRHFDMDRPQNQRKLDLVDDLLTIAADAGLSLIEMANAFVLAHPAVTTTIIGPRTVDQLDGLLAGADTRLDDATLDRIDRLVPPGLNVSPDWQTYDHSKPTLRGHVIER